MHLDHTVKVKLEKVRGCGRREVERWTDGSCRQMSALSYLLKTNTGFNPHPPGLMGEGSIYVNKYADLEFSTEVELREIPRPRAVGGDFREEVAFGRGAGIREAE